MADVRMIPLLLLVFMTITKPAAARGTDREDRMHGLRLMTFNVNYANPDPDAALDAIAKANVDVVLLQEITSKWQRKLTARLGKQYPYRAFRMHTRSPGGIAVLSKFPIKAKEILASPERGWFPAQRLLLDTPFGALQILHVHLRPAVDGDSWIKGFIATPPMRMREIRSYWKHMEADIPTIVAGDFNEDPAGRVVDFLGTKQLARVPTPTTGPTTWRYRDTLQMDIDHVVIDGKLDASDAEVIDAGASDHRPVVVTIKPKQ